MPSPIRAVRNLLRNLPALGSAIDYSRRNIPTLTQDEANMFHGAGYLIIDPEIEGDVLDRAVQSVLDRPEVKGVNHHGTRVFNAWKTTPAIRTIALAPRVLRILRQLYGREPKPFQTLNFPIGTEQKVHSDTIHFNCDPPTYMCGVWVALEDIDLENGALIYSTT